MTWSKKANRIEGIIRPPMEAEIREHERFVGLENLTISELQTFVKIYQRNASFRGFPGMDVQVGSYVLKMPKPYLLTFLIRTSNCAQQRFVRLLLSRFGVLDFRSGPVRCASHDR
jgi:hypothetical protein